MILLIGNKEFFRENRNIYKFAIINGYNGLKTKLPIIKYNKSHPIFYIT